MRQPGHLGELLDQVLAVGSWKEPRPGQDLGKQFLEEGVAVGVVDQGTHEAGSELDDLSFTLRSGRRHDDEIISVASPQPQCAPGSEPPGGCGGTLDELGEGNVLQWQAQTSTVTQHCGDIGDS